MGSFSINQNNLDKNILNFIDIIYSNSLYPIINTPARAMSISFTLIDNISFNDTLLEIYHNLRFRSLKRIVVVPNEISYKPIPQ